jgi:Gly-Xaa carboxypeptidase
MKGDIEKQGHRDYSIWRKFIKFGLISAIALHLIAASFSQYSKRFIDHEVELKVQELLNEPEVEPLRPKSYLSHPEFFREIIDDKGFHDSALVNFQGAVQIDTQSFDNAPNPKDDIRPWLKFFDLHKYLEKTFPLVHKTLKLEKPNKINLLYTWTGSNPDLKPLLLTAHQDTVPIDANSVDQWVHEPLSGYYDGEFVWGRGSIDCKQLLVGLLETVEKLIKDGFKPERTIVLGFGHDEESGGVGAAAINDTLTERYGHNSFYALVDEGASIQELDGQWYALPGTSEKGRINLEISLSTPGGHSSVPPDHTSIGIISQLVNALEANPFKAAALTSRNPYLKFLQTLAKTSKSLPEHLRQDILRAEFDDKANARVVEWVTSDINQRYLIQTSQAIDVIKGGVKSNALPEFVSITYNSRVSVESTVNVTVEHVLDSVKAIAKKFNLGIYLNDEIIAEPTSNGVFKIEYTEFIEALPVTPASGSVWDVLAGTLKHVFQDEVLPEGDQIHIAPGIMTANTDTKSYYKLTENVFRFYGARIDLFKENLGLHSLNEHIPFAKYLEGISFLYEFIQNVDEATEN